MPLSGSVQEVHIAISLIPRGTGIAKIGGFAEL